MTDKHVYLFSEGKGDMKNLLGGKGANLAEMTRIGLTVPPGFIITTEVCNKYNAGGKKMPKDLMAQVRKAMKTLEKDTGKTFGDMKKPLLVSVRSGARVSMPGMMDTILNLGLNDETVLALAKATKNDRFAWDCYRRFIQMYGDVVMGVQKLPGEDIDPFESIIHELKHKRYKKAIEDTKLTVDDIKELVKQYKALIKSRVGKSFPSDPWQQLEGAIGAVFDSWMNDRAVVYRRKYGYPADWGTAVNVQTMVFGNTGDLSGSGVAFTRNPANGVKEFYGEFLMNAQGEDVVAGVRTPEPVAKLAKVMPSAFKELDRNRSILEKHFRDVQDFEFTIEDGKVFMLQTRNGKRTAQAALKISVDLYNEKLIDWKKAVMLNPANQLDQILAPVFDLEDIKKSKVMATGLAAGPGAASGQIYFNADRAVEAAEKGKKVVLVRVETSPEDLRGMIAAEGILTATGGVSSHAALVARQMGKVCVCGASDLTVDYSKKTVSAKGVTLKEGDYISIDGTAGTVYPRLIKSKASEIIAGLLHGDKAARKTEKYKNFQLLMDWCSKATRMKVRTNADNPEQTRNAVLFGAQGIGLCRTEHMFFEGNRIDAMREMILAEDLKDRQKALKKILPYQRDDFIGIFTELNGYPATIRLLDPPLHEFLPHTDDQQKDLSRKLGIPVKKIKERVEDLHEFNPMLGHRGCRLGIAYPEITEMQARAIFEAAAFVLKKKIKVNPEVMIPLVGFAREFQLQADIIHRVAKEVMAEKKIKFTYLVGTMIEVPRGALTANEIAETAEFFSFGTNDLTQMSMGISRDDMGHFLGNYTENDIFKSNPFATLDITGVGQLMEMAVAKGQKTRPNIKLGICGEHGGDPESVKFCHKLGLDYVSCSPFRVPVARLAAAQAAIEDEEKAAKPKAKKAARK
jgi:pyruvate,orthophosphate dikinase